MPDPILLSDAEISAVAGGRIRQSIDIDAHQRNSSSVTQTATATNSGAVTASAPGANSTALAFGATSANTAVVTQANAISATNRVLFD
jgi:hypothetical protein